MIQSQLVNQMIQFNKTVFDNSYNAMEMLWKQGEKTTSTLLEQAVWLPEEGQKAIQAWMQTYKKGCDVFKKAVDQNYKNVEDLFVFLTE